MASTQLSPGVAVLERDLTNVVSTTVDNVAAIVGSFEKGPVEAITTVTSEKELLNLFGRPTEYNYEYWFTAAQFLLYGGTLRVVRAMNDSLKNAIDTAQFTVTTFDATDTTLTVQSTTDFDVNDVLLVDAELMTVQAVSGNDATVQRGQLATSAAAHAALQASPSSSSRVLQPQLMKVLPSPTLTPLLQLPPWQLWVAAQTLISELTMSFCKSLASLVKT